MRLRPRFSLRTLVILVTLVCAYFGAWEATKRWGSKEYGTPVEDDPGTVRFTYPEEVSPMPFLIRCDEATYFYMSHVGSGSTHISTYYLWLPGLKIKIGVHRTEVMDNELN